MKHLSVYYSKNFFNGHGNIILFKEWWKLFISKNLFFESSQFYCRENVTQIFFYTKKLNEINETYMTNKLSILSDIKYK